MSASLSEAFGVDISGMKEGDKFGVDIRVSDEVYDLPDLQSTYLEP